MSDYVLLSFREEAREKLLKGADQLARAVTSTLGPRSRNVAISRGYSIAPKVVHDGVTVANAIYLRDPFENMGAQLLREAAVRANEIAGDGTTTATLIANTLLQKGMNLIAGKPVDDVLVGKVNPMYLREQLEIYAEKIGELLLKVSKPIKEKHEYFEVARISSGMDDIAQLVADAIEQVGLSGVILVDESEMFESRIEKKEGYQFDNGWLSRFFVTDSDRMVAEYKDGLVLVTDHFITDATAVGSIMDMVKKERGETPILIIAGDVQGPAVTAFAKTKLSLGRRIVAVKAPGYAWNQTQTLEDIALVTGATFVSSGLGQRLEDVKMTNLGKFEQIRVTEGTTTIVPKHPDKDEIGERVTSIKEQLKAETRQHVKFLLEQRIERLSQNLVTIYIGGYGINTQIDERRERAIDAVNAARAALEEGVIPGGGTTLWKIAKIFEEVANDDPVRELVLQALRTPFERLLENSGIEGLSEEEVAQNILDKKYVYDVMSKAWVDPNTSLIVDPVKVTRTAVTRAFHVAAMMLTTDTLVSPDLEADRGIQKVKPV